MPPPPFKPPTPPSPHPIIWHCSRWNQTEERGHRDLGRCVKRVWARKKIKYRGRPLPYCNNFQGGPSGFIDFCRQTDTNLSRNAESQSSAPNKHTPMRKQTENESRGGDVRKEVLIIADKRQWILSVSRARHQSAVKRC